MAAHALLKARLYGRLRVVHQFEDILFATIRSEDLDSVVSGTPVPGGRK
jgi:hypothetical protein